MGDYHTPPDTAQWLRGVEERLAALERRTQQARMPLALAEGGPTSITSGVVTDGTLSDITYGEETGVEIDPGFPYRLRVPQAGVYMIVGYANFAASVIGDRWLELFTGTGIDAGGHTNGRASSDSLSTTNVSVAKLAFLPAGGTAWLRVTQNSGGSLTTFWRLGVAYVGIAV